jgi:predicted nucleic acid-binding Zn ribbon protein
MALHRRSPRGVTHALVPLQEAIAPRTLLAEAQAAWPTVVGATIAREAEPVSERAGTLTVRCGAAVWAQELELMGEDIADRLNTILSTGRITRLRCVVGTR